MAVMHIKVEGVPGWDGTYDLDADWFTNRELNIIKKTAGVRAGELQEALAAGDNDVIIAYTQIAIRRATGRDVHPDLLLDAKVGSITVDVELGADEQDPQSGENESGSGTAETPQPSGASLSEPSPSPLEKSQPVTGAPV